MPARDDDYDDDRPRRRDRDDDDYDEDDRPRRRGAPQTNGVALAGLIVGVVSLLLACPAPLALLLSGIGLSRAGSRGGAGRGQAIGGLVTGGIALVFSVPLLLIGLMLPAVQSVRDAAARAKQSNNMKQVALAADNYESATGSFPVAVARDPAAELRPDQGAPPDPSTRLGWRADVLPYIEQQALYKALDFGQAWNSPTNAPIANMVVPTYADPADGPPTAQTRLRGFTGNGAMFDPDPSHKVTAAGVTDGLSNTILFAESTVTVPWAQNNELPFAPAGPLPPLGHPGRDVFLACMADGSVRAVRKTVNPAALRAAITYKGGEQAMPLE